MLSVIFFLLKIIGVILKVIGILLLIILLLLALIAFVPVRYRFVAVVPEKKKRSSVNVRVNWFGFLFVVKGGYEEGKLDYVVRILGHQIIGNQPSFLKAQEEKKKKKKDRAKKKKRKNGKLKSKKTKRTAIEAEVKTKKEKTVEKKEVPTTEVETTKVESRQKVKQQKTSQKQSSKEKVEDKKKSERKESSESILSKGKDFVNEIKEIWGEYHIGENIPFVKEILLKTLKHIFPRRLKGHLEVGLKNPEWMGYFTAGMAMMYPVYGKYFLFTPYFKETKLEADCEGRGRIQLGFFVYIGIRLLMNKDVRKLIFG